MGSFNIRPCDEIFKVHCKCLYFTAYSYTEDAGPAEPGVPGVPLALQIFRKSVHKWSLAPLEFARSTYDGPPRIL